MCVRVSVSVYLRVFVYLCVCVCVCVCMCMYVYVYVCVCWGAGLYIYTYIYIHTHYSSPKLDFLLRFTAGVLAIIIVFLSSGRRVEYVYGNYVITRVDCKGQWCDVCPGEFVCFFFIYK